MLETVQGRLRRVAEEANYFDAVLDSMNQVQTGLESLLAEITGFDSWHADADAADRELAVSTCAPSSLLFLHSPPRARSANRKRFRIRVPRPAGNARLATKSRAVNYSGALGGRAGARSRVRTRLV